MKYKGVIFDLDGTLVNSIFDIADSMNSVLKKHNFPTHNYDDYQIFIGNGVRSLVALALPDTRNNEQEINQHFDEMIEFYRDNCTNKTKAYDGITELLDQLKSRNIKLGVLSNKVDEFTKVVVSHIFPNTFDFVYGLTTETLKKPNPSKALEISDKMGLKPQEIIFVGDTGVDIQTAINANMYAVGVLWGFRTEDVLRANGANHIISNPLELSEII